MTAILLAAAGPALASGHLNRGDVEGLWGTERQCAGRPLLDGATRRAEPFDIDGGWLRHGSTWCRLSWFTPSIRDDEIYVAATALCGEDGVQAYALAFHYSARPVPELTLIWDQELTNGPLRRCADSD